MYINQFENSTQKIDERISMCIDSELQKLEDISDSSVISNQINNRRNAIKNLFNTDFDANFEILTKSKHAQSLKPTQSPNESYLKRKALDRVMKKKIYTGLDNLYHSISLYSTSSNQKMYLKELSQILDRQLAINWLLEDFDNNLLYLENYNSQTHSVNKDYR